MSKPLLLHRRPSRTRIFGSPDSYPKASIQNQIVDRHDRVQDSSALQHADASSVKLSLGETPNTTTRCFNCKHHTASKASAKERGSLTDRPHGTPCNRSYSGAVMRPLPRARQRPTETKSPRTWEWFELPPRRTSSSDRTHDICLHHPGMFVLHSLHHERGE